MLLNDEQLVGLDPNVIKGLKRSGDLYTATSPIQPASVDLTIGDIFLPETEDAKGGSLQKPLSYYSLRAGHTAIVQTKEELDLPSHLAAIGFPPSRVSSKGPLMTNPGHVDPGYKGHMKFTVINMGRESYPLKSDEIIVTLLIFSLDPPAKKSFSERVSNIQGRVGEEELSRLGRDFLDVERRASEVAKKFGWIGLGVPIIVAALTLYGTINKTENYTDAKVHDLEKKMMDNKTSQDKEIAAINNKLGHLNLEKRLEELEKLVKKPEARSPKR